MTYRRGVDCDASHDVVTRFRHCGTGCFENGNISGKGMRERKKYIPRWSTFKFSVFRPCPDDVK